LRRRGLFAALLAGALLVVQPAAAEVCRFAGTTSYAGQIAVVTEASLAGGLLTLDVTASLTASTPWFSDLQYRTQEISIWRGGVLQSLAVNTRYGLDGTIKRQQWDVYTLRAGRLEARRVQAKTLPDFQRRHPAFARHWAPAAFGLPWLQDYGAAAPERRPDLDLASMPAGLRPPLAFAFYWSRFLAQGGQAVPVFLPGFKRDARADVPVGAAMAGEGWQRWPVALRHPGLGAAPSTAAAWVSNDGRLLQLAFDVQGRPGAARGLIRAQGCQGFPVRDD